MFLRLFLYLSGLIEEKNNFIPIRTQKPIAKTEFTKNAVFVPIVFITPVHSLAWAVSTACGDFDRVNNFPQKCFKIKGKSPFSRTYIILKFSSGNLGKIKVAIFT